MVPKDVRPGRKSMRLLECGVPYENDTPIKSGLPFRDLTARLEYEIMVAMGRPWSLPEIKPNDS